MTDNPKVPVREDLQELHRMAISEDAAICVWRDGVWMCEGDFGHAWWHDLDKLIERASRAEAALEALQVALKDSAAVHINILRGDIALTKAQAIHIAGLPADIEQQLEALQWTPISETNLPTYGCEVYGSHCSHLSHVTEGMLRWAYKDYKWRGWTHFRPINPPRIEEKPNGEKYRTGIM